MRRTAPTGLYPDNRPSAHPGTGLAKLCCKVAAACKCGKNFTGNHGQRDFKRHQKKCSAGAAPLVPIA